jgi:phospho-N-acetylmuramoyl-pentapeptide-transferase
MLLWLTDWLSQYDSGFAVFRYLTLRTILGVLTALGISLLVGRPMIRWLSSYKVGQVVRRTARRATSPRPARRPWAAP